MLIEISIEIGYTSLAVWHPAAAAMKMDEGVDW